MKARRTIVHPKHVHLLAPGARSVTLCGARVWCAKPDVKARETSSGVGGFIRLSREGIAYLRRFLRERGKLCNECTIVAARDHGLILAWTFETGVGARRSAQLQGKFR